jgi:hypothetical protein
MCHVHIDPETTNAFKGPVVSSLTLTIKPGVERQQVAEGVNAIVEACRGFDKCHGMGWGFTKGDENKVVVVGSWETKEVCTWDPSDFREAPGSRVIVSLIFFCFNFFFKAHVEGFMSTEECKKVVPGFSVIVEDYESFHMEIKHYA